MVLRDAGQPGGRRRTTAYDAGTRHRDADAARPPSPTPRATPSASAAPATPAATPWPRSRGASRPPRRRRPASTTGPGGPIAVVTSSGNPSSSYLAEILRAEGLNEFANLRVIDADRRHPRAVRRGGARRRRASPTPRSTALTDVGQRRRQPGRDAARRAPATAWPGITAQAGTVADGYLARRTPPSEPGAGHHHRHHAVPRHRQPLHARGATVGGRRSTPRATAEHRPARP